MNSHLVRFPNSNPNPTPNPNPDPGGNSPGWGVGGAIYWGGIWPGGNSPGATYQGGDLMGGIHPGDFLDTDLTMPLYLFLSFFSEAT